MDRMFTRKSVRRAAIAVAVGALAIVGGVVLDAGSASAQADVSITIDDGVATVNQSGSVTYTIVVSNPSLEDTTATVADLVPGALGSVSWTCVPTGLATCTPTGAGNILESVTLPAGSAVTFTVNATVAFNAFGTITNTATVVAANDPNGANDTASDVDTVAVSADLSITKTDGVVTATPGGSVTYTITASNAGTDFVTGATVADTFPAALTATWTCVGAGGGTCTASGSGNINDTTVVLPSGGSVTYTVSATIAAAATGTLSNTATVAPPAGAVDPTPANNSATDTDTLTPQADLAITKTDGVTTATPGGSVTYTITASNAGPSNAPGATVADTFPAALTATWTCVGAGGGTCPASGSGNIGSTVNLPAGGSVTFTASATISASVTGTLSNTATVAAPGGVTDPTPGNNSATDSDTLVPAADLSITKTDGVTSVLFGGSVTYTITASNAGPSNAFGATVADTFPALLTVTSWACVGAGGGTCTASGSGNISDTVTLPAGGSVIYTVNANVGAGTGGTVLSNTATVAPPAGVTDATPGNNSATDTDTVTDGTADLTITKTDGATSAVPGGSVTYTITAANAGPTATTGVTVADSFPLPLTATWTCVGAGGGTCTASGSGAINDTTVNLPVGGSVTYTASATIPASATGTIANTATVAGPLTDLVPGNNSATDTDTLTPQADLAVTKTDGITAVVWGGPVAYTVTVSNAGPSNAIGATVADTMQANIAAATWTCVGAGGGTCTASGNDDINDTVNLPVGGSVVYTVHATVVAGTGSGTLANMATVIAPAGVTDLAPVNNSATDTDTITQASADVSVTKTGPANAAPGSNVTYTINASNAGPDAATTVVLTDALPAGVTFVSITQNSGPAATLTTPAVGGTGSVTATWAALASGASASFTLTVNVGAGFSGNLNNTAMITSDAGDVDSADNASLAAVAVTTTTTTTIAPTTTTTVVVNPVTVPTTTAASTTTTIAAGLPATGSDPSGLVLAVILLLVGGGALVLIARRRTQPSTD